MNFFPRPRLALAVLILAVPIWVAGMVAPFGLRPAWADGCTAGSGPSAGAGTAALYGELASSVSAEPLSIAIATRAIGGSCTWVYEVKVLTVSGSIALLDFDLVDLELMRVEGPADDPDIAKLHERLTREAASRSKATGESADTNSGASPESGDSSGSGSGSGSSGSSGSGSGDGDGGDSDGDGGDSDGGDSDGGDSDGGE